MSAIEGVSEIFDPQAWDVVPGFEDLTDLTYHRARDHGTVRIAFDRPDVLNAFRPHTVDELLRTLEHARTSADVGCVILTGNGPSPKNGKWSFCSGGDQRIRGRAGYQYETAGLDDAGADPNPIDRARLARLHILECQRLIRFMPKVVICVVPGWAAGGGHSLHVVADLTLASREHARFKQTDAGRPAGDDADDDLRHEADQPLALEDVEPPGTGGVDGVGRVPAGVLITAAAPDALVASRAERPAPVPGRRPVPGEQHATHVR